MRTWIQKEESRTMAQSNSRGYAPMLIWSDLNSQVPSRLSLNLRWFFSFLPFTPPPPEQILWNLRKFITQQCKDTGAGIPAELFTELLAYFKNAKPEYTALAEALIKKIDLAQATDLLNETTRNLAAQRTDDLVISRINLCARLHASLKTNLSARQNLLAQLAKSTVSTKLKVNLAFPFLSKDELTIFIGKDLPTNDSLDYLIYSLQCWEAYGFKSMPIYKPTMWLRKILCLQEYLHSNLAASSKDKLAKFFSYESREDKHQLAVCNQLIRTISLTQHPTLKQALALILRGAQVIYREKNHVFVPNAFHTCFLILYTEDESALDNYLLAMSAKALVKINQGFKEQVLELPAESQLCILQNLMEQAQEEIEDLLLETGRRLPADNPELKLLEQAWDRIFSSGNSEAANENDKRTIYTLIEQLKPKLEKSFGERLRAWFSGFCESYRLKTILTLGRAKEPSSATCLPAPKPALDPALNTLIPPRPRYVKHHYLAP